jgi:SAM-dependent methyltransferase
MTHNFHYTGTELDSLVEARNYYRAILKLFRPYIGARVVEVGAGIGTFSSFLLDLESVRELIALEPAVNLFPLLNHRFSGDTRVRCVNRCLCGDLAYGDIDTVVSVNVLEHIENDGEFLRSAERILAPGGTLLLFTPALPSLYGSLDRQFGHYRRYSKLELAEELQAAGFVLESLRYFDLPGLLGWLVAAKVLRWDSFRPADVRRYDRLVFSWAAKIENWWEPPLGKNLLAIGRKPLREA